MYLVFNLWSLFATQSCCMMGLAMPIHNIMYFLYLLGVETSLNYVGLIRLHTKFYFCVEIT